MFVISLLQQCKMVMKVYLILTYLNLCVLTKTRKLEYVSPVLKYFHVLPVARRTDLRTLILVCK